VCNDLHVLRDTLFIRKEGVVIIVVIVGLQLRDFRVEIENTGVVNGDGA